MALVVKPIVVPAALTDQSNGRLTLTLLSSTPGLAGGPTVRLLTEAARAWRAMAASAQTAGVTLKATGYADSYRTYDQQVALFTDRYQTDPTLNGWRLWDSDGSGTAERWYKKDNVASAAVPGTSNHGWALAVDVANASGARLDWLQDHALAFGWSWELVPEEPWHLHYYTGDAIPAAVLDYEARLREDDDVTQILVDDGTGQVWLCDGQFRRKVEPEWLGAAFTGPITNAQVHQAGLLGNTKTKQPGDANTWRGNNQIMMSGGDMDVWGIDIATLQGGAGTAPAGPVDVSDESLARIRTIVDEELDEQSISGADTDQ